MAGELYHGLLTQVASEHFYFWLNSLKEFSKAEEGLTGLQDSESSVALARIAEALKHYQRGIASLTVGLTFCFFLSGPNYLGNLLKGAGS